MKPALKILTVLSLFFALQFAAPTEAIAQCPMCRMSAESNLRNGGSEGRGLNTGILYMFAAPYVLVGFLGYVWYRNRKKGEEEVA